MEITPKICPCPHAFKRPPIKNPGAHPTDRLIALQQAQALQFGFQHKTAVKLLIPRLEHDIHFRTRIRTDTVDIEPAGRQIAEYVPNAEVG
ncbi:hypothetical protein BCD52_01715 [Neisseria meningitidis]|nr:hypothetical protein [Neisseria meningitidis]